MSSTRTCSSRPPIERRSDTRMHQEVLNALIAVGVRPDAKGNIKLYHSTPAVAAEAIRFELKLRPPAVADEPDPALRELQTRHGGFVYMASSPTIGEDLAHGEVLLEVTIPTTVDAEVSRVVDGRIEVVVQLPPGSSGLDLISADRA
jgi:hypothetical protein